MCCLTSHGSVLAVCEGLLEEVQIWKRREGLQASPWSNWRARVASCCPLARRTTCSEGKRLLSIVVQDRLRENVTKKVGILLTLVLLSSLLVVGCTGAKDLGAEQQQAVASERTSSKQTNSEPTEKKPADSGRRAEAGAVVVRAGEEAVAQAGTHGKHTIARVGGTNVKGEDGTSNATAHPAEVMLKIEGSPGTEFSGTCTVGGKENKISGRVPESFVYKPDGQRLECEIRKQSSNSGVLTVMFTAGDHTHSVQQTSAQGSTITLRYESGESTDLCSSATSVSGGQANSSSHVSVSQSSCAHIGNDF